MGSFSPPKKKKKHVRLIGDSKRTLEANVSMGGCLCRLSLGDGLATCPGCALALQALRRERVFRDHVDILAETDEWLTSRFRLPRTVLLQTCSLLEPQLQRETHPPSPIPPHVQVLTTLGFLATGTFQREIGDRSGVPQSSVSRALPLVIKALISLSPMEHQIPVHRCPTSTN